MLQFPSRPAQSRSSKASRCRHIRAAYIEFLEARTLLSATPTGLVDVFSRTQISGWAFDTDDGSTAVNVEITLNGVKTVISADQSQSDVPATLGSPDHGFTFTLPTLPPGNSSLTVVAVSPSTGVRKTLKSGTLTNPGPIGKVESLTATTISGWAYDADSTSPIQVRIDIDGVAGTPFTTNVPRADLNTKYHVQNLGFSVTGSFVGHVVEVYAYDAPSGTPTLIYTNNQLPKGKVEVNNGLVVSGWAQDPDAPTAAVNVRVAIDGVMLPGSATSANLPRQDLVKTLSSANHGYSISIPGLTQGTHKIAVYAIDVEANSATPVLLGQTTINAATPLGNVDVFNRNTISGWAYDLVDGSAPMNIDITVNGVTTTIAADQSQADVPATLGSPYHGFTYTLPALPPGNSSISVVAVSPATGARKTLKSGTLVNPPPQGKVEVLTGTTISGWAYDPDSTSPIMVRVDVDGVAGIPFTTNVQRDDLNAKYHVQNLGFSLTGDFAGHVIEVYAFDAPSGIAKLIYSNNHIAKGKVEVANGTTITGWAQDPDSPTTPVNVQVDVDGVPIDNMPVLADIVRNDLTKTLGSPNHGFNINIPGLTPGKHVITVYALDGQANSATPVLIGKATVPNAPPVGHIDTVNSSVVSGWALDPDLGAAPTDVRVYVDDSLFATVTADQSRPDLTAKYHSPNHGFSVDLSSLPDGSHSITVTALDNQASDQNEVVIYDGFINNQTPSGSVDPITGSQITGWAYDPDAGPDPVAVDIYVDGVYCKTVTADQPGSEGNLSSPNHAFATDLPSLSFGTHKIDVYASESQGNSSVLIGSQLVTNHQPIGFVESANSTTVSGWAADPDLLGQSVQVQVWINGVLAVASTADVARTDLLTSPPFSSMPGYSQYGFNVSLPTLSTGSNQIDVYAVDPNNGMLQPLGSKVIVV